MSVIKSKPRANVKVVTVDGARFEGEISSRDEKGLYMKIETPMGRDRFVFVSHHAISHLEVER